MAGDVSTRNCNLEEDAAEGVKRKVPVTRNAACSKGGDRPPLFQSPKRQRVIYAEEPQTFESDSAPSESSGCDTGDEYAPSKNGSGSSAESEHDEEQTSCSSSASMPGRQQQQSQSARMGSSQTYYSASKSAMETGRNRLQATDAMSMLTLYFDKNLNKPFETDMEEFKNCSNQYQFPAPPKMFLEWLREPFGVPPQLAKELKAGADAIYRPRLGVFAELPEHIGRIIKCVKEGQTPPEIEAFAEHSKGAWPEPYDSRVHIKKTLYIAPSKRNKLTRPHAVHSCPGRYSNVIVRAENGSGGLQYGRLLLLFEIKLDSTYWDPKSRCRRRVVAPLPCAFVHWYRLKEDLEGSATGSV